MVKANLCFKSLVCEDEKRIFLYIEVGIEQQAKSCGS